MTDQNPIERIEMTTPNIEELRKLAEECLDRDPLEEGDVSFPGFSTSWCALQREFIMAANPSTVIALLDQLQSQAERIAELERESETHSKAYGLAIVERDNLRHELKTAQEGWRCECSTDDACRFARERDALRAQLAAIAATEPVAWFAFADSNGPVPLELFGWDEKACKHAVLTYARAGNWKGTVEGYLLQQGWTLKPLFTRPMPAESKDAERYRWFADIAVNGYFDKAEKAFACFESAESCTKQELDAAIDAAIAKGAK